MVSFLNSRYSILLGSSTTVPFSSGSFQLGSGATCVGCRSLGLMDSTATSCGSGALSSSSPWSKWNAWWNSTSGREHEVTGASHRSSQNLFQ